MIRIRSLSSYIALSVLLIGIVVAGLGLRAAQTPAVAATGPKTLVIAYSSAPADLDPFTSFELAGGAILRGTYEGLVRTKGRSTTQIEGVLATSWRSTQGGRVWTFQLRRNVRFHDGTPFTAAAVRASYARVINVDQGPAFIVGQFVKPGNIQVLGRYTVRFRLKSPSDVFLRALASQWGTWIVSPKALRQHRGNLHRWLQTHDAGTGPYVLSRIVPGQSTTLTRFNGYWRGWRGRHVNRVIINVVQATATRRAQIERGDADLTESLTPNDLVALRRNRSVVVDASYGMANLEMVMTQVGPLRSPLARRALAYAFDYRAFIRDVLRGYGRQAQGPTPRTLLGHDFSLPLYSTNLRKARALLRRAGVKAGTRLTVFYNAANEEARNAALIMQVQLAKLGLSLSLQGRDNSSLVSLYYGDTPPSRRPNLIVWDEAPDYNDPGDWLYPYYYSGQAGSKGANGGFYANRTVDRLLNRAALMANTGRRLKLYRQVQHIVAWDDPAAVFLVDLATSTVYRRSLHGYYLNPVYTGTYDLYAMWKS